MSDDVQQAARMRKGSSRLTAISAPAGGDRSVHVRSIPASWLVRHPAVLRRVLPDERHHVRNRPAGAKDVHEDHPEAKSHGKWSQSPG